MTGVNDQPAARGFGSELAVRAVSATTWRLTEPLVWTGTKGDTFTVPAGFVTDFATIPRFLHWLVSPYGPYTRAAVLHDWLLVELANWSQNWAARDEPYPGNPIGANLPPADSRDADGIFRRVMQDLGVSWAKRWTMWAAVRLAACFSSRRAYGRNFGADAARVLTVAVLAIPIALPGAVGVLISLALARPFAGSKTPSARADG
jgi:hypothetical protein